MSNDELLISVAGAIRAAEHRLNELMAALDASGGLLIAESAGEINRIAAHLIVASAAANELNNRALGLKPPLKWN